MAPWGLLNIRPFVLTTVTSAHPLALQNLWTKVLLCFWVSKCLLSLEGTLLLSLFYLLTLYPFLILFHSKPSERQVFPSLPSLFPHWWSHPNPLHCGSWLWFSSDLYFWKSLYPWSPVKDFHGASPSWSLGGIWPLLCVVPVVSLTLWCRVLQSLRPFLCLFRPLFSPKYEDSSKFCT